ncbi:MAG: hypothetical protein QOF12_2572, partial [Solirubrobacteraceae bacterium]|nr:hypothetical protein [Solirubrobacteraceae bacterium]
MRILRGVFALALAGALAGVTAVTADATTTIATLGEGSTAFWPGAFVSSARVDDPSLCGIVGPCFDYGLKVTAASAKVLRVAVSTSDDSNGWDVELLDPAGNVAASGSTYELDGFAEDYDKELFAHQPKPGLWTVRVIPHNVQIGDFKARAALDPAVATVPACSPLASARIALPARIVAAGARSATVYIDGHRQTVVRGARRSVSVSLAGLPPEVAVIRLVIDTTRGAMTVTRRIETCPAQARSADALTMPPDLAADPPWHLTFDQPPPMVVVEGGNYTAIAGVHNPTMQVGGQPIYGCLAEETIEQGAHRCLRFTSGFASLGPGPFQVFGASSTVASPQGGPLYQVVYRTDGSHFERPAGRYVFHHIHAHYHVLGIAEFLFYRVGPRHTLTVAGKVLKEGFCLGNIKIYDWHSFGQQEIDPRSVNNCEPTPQPDGSYRFYEGIANGWEDSYKWQTSGQYVDFGNDADGYYLLRVEANPARSLLET